MKTKIIYAFILTIIPVIVTALIYGSFAFVMFETNPGAWSVEARYFMASMSVALSTAGVFLFCSLRVKP